MQSAQDEEIVYITHDAKLMTVNEIIKQKWKKYKDSQAM